MKAILVIAALAVLFCTGHEEPLFNQEDTIAKSAVYPDQRGFDDTIPETLA